MSISRKVCCIPQMVEINTPRLLDASGEFISYSYYEDKKENMMPRKSEDHKLGKERSFKQGRARQQDQEGKSAGRNHPKKRAQGEQAIERGAGRLFNSGQAKNGCFPKLAMLILPMLGTAAYFLLRS